MDCPNPANRVALNSMAKNHTICVLHAICQDATRSVAAGSIETKSANACRRVNARHADKQNANANPQCSVKIAG
jgi:hypothetical protein